MALQAGANDLGGTLMNEHISRAAGASHGQEMNPAGMRALVAALPPDAGNTSSNAKGGCFSSALLMRGLALARRNFFAAGPADSNTSHNRDASECRVGKD